MSALPVPLRQFTLILFFVAIATTSLIGVGSAATTQVTLAWDANADQTIAGYRIYYSVGTAGPPYSGEGLAQGPSPIEVPLNLIKDAQHPEFSLTGLSVGTYFFACTAYDNDGNESGYSNEVHLTVTADNEPPATPTDISAVVLDANRVMLTWTAVEDAGGNGMVAYRVYRDGELVGTTDETIYMDSGLLASTAYAYAIAAVDPAGNTSDLSAALTTATRTESDINLRVNCGGGSYLDSAGHQWQADVGFSDGSVASTSDVISRTQDDALFQSARLGANLKDHLIYRFDVPNGEYQVNLYFVDFLDKTAGSGLRVFDTFIEGQPVQDDLDIYAQVGHDAALITTFTTVVFDGELKIDFVDQTRNPKIAAIEFFHTGATAPAPGTYRVTASALANGTISPAGVTTVQSGDNLTFEMTPTAHHHISQVYVDDVPVGAVRTYRFNDINRNHTIRAEFAVDTYMITTDSGTAGQIAPSGPLYVAHGESITLQITPNAHREIADVIVNGESVGSVSSYTLSNVSRNCTVAASFVADRHTVEAIAEGSGSISPSGASTVACGESLTYRITPEAHHHVEDVWVDGKSVGAVTTYTFDKLEADHKITARFAIDEYVISTSMTGKGNISPAGPIKAPHGSDLGFTVKPAAGYVVTDVRIDGESVGVTHAPVLSNIRADRNVVVEFAPESVDLPTFETGEVIIDHKWTRIGFTHSYSEPIVVARSLSINGRDPAVVRIRNVGPTGFDLRVQEWDYRDGKHVKEQIGYLVMERGVYTLNDGTRIEASTFDSHRTNGFEPVLFERAFNEAPIVLASVVSVNEVDAVAGRMRGISKEGFSFGMREQELNDQRHAAETIGYIAWEPSKGTIDGRMFQVARTKNVVTHASHTLTFGVKMAKAPIFLAAMQTTDGNDTANIRWRNKSAASVEIHIDEERSRDKETNHTSEAIGYMIFGN
ncbi:MAG: malectin domain-containing carbohydrate-binding protein [Desulfosarcinaceae bacterium]|nr:malectin domain-containing carbohydrate-binding protein [Desulfosarcinaceae bacterium]